MSEFGFKISANGNRDLAERRGWADKNIKKYEENLDHKALMELQGSNDFQRVQENHRNNRIEPIIPSQANKYFFFARELSDEFNREFPEGGQIAGQDARANMLSKAIKICSKIGWLEAGYREVSEDPNVLKEQVLLASSIGFAINANGDIGHLRYLADRGVERMLDERSVMVGDKLRKLHGIQVESIDYYQAKEYLDFARHNSPKFNGRFPADKEITSWDAQASGLSQAIDTCSYEPGVRADLKAQVLAATATGFEIKKDSDLDRLRASADRVMWQAKKEAALKIVEERANHDQSGALTPRSSLLREVVRTAAQPQTRIPTSSQSVRGAQ
ncbi:hypothetical protein [Ralstonia psammae]|uniref:hypothetical protein n=1 Tax=Ralstonia psammae TaxID=3058598 RepID=UPI002930B9DD|nr:hypothetical protein [Ralstonia sp. LMG 19083]